MGSSKPSVRNADFSERVAELREAVEDVYRAFKRYPFKPEFTRYFNRNHPTPIQPSLRLRHLTAEQLEWAAGSGFNFEVGFRPILPRILQIVAESGAVAGTSAPHVFRCFSDGKWTHWIELEQVAIARYMSALWFRVLAEFPCSLTGAEEALCAVSQVLDDVDPLLNAWKWSYEPASSRHLAQFAAECCASLERKSELPDAFWDRRKASTAQVINMLHDPRVLAHLENLLSKFLDVPDAALFAGAADTLRAFQLRST